MSIVDRVRDMTSNAVDQGQQRIDSIRSDRRRSQLLHELGEARYAQSKGVATSEAEIARIIGEIDDLGLDDSSAPGAAGTAADDSDTSESNTE